MFLLISHRKMTGGQRARRILSKAGGLLLKSHPGFFSLAPTKQHCVLVREERRQTLKELSMNLQGTD